MRHLVEPDQRYVLDLDGVREVHVFVVAGDVSVGGTSGPARLEAECIEGDPLLVLFDDGVLVVEHRYEESKTLVSIGRQLPQVAAVAITVPPDIPVDVRTVTAPILAAGIAADVELKTVSGEVTCSYLGGQVVVSTVSGQVDVDGVSGSFRASTVSGDVTVNGGCVTEFAAKSVSGDVTVDVDVKPDGTYHFTTMSGSVGVRVPDDAALDVEATTLSGRLKLNLPVADERSSKRRMRARLGAGGARLRANTLSGDFVLVGKNTPREIEAAV